MEKYYKLLIAAIWTSGVIVRYSRVVIFRASGRNEDLAFGLEYALFAVLAVASIPYIIRRFNISALFLFILFACVYLLSMRFSEYSVAIAYLEKNQWNYLLANLPLIFVGSVLLNENNVYYLRKVSALSIIVNLLCMVVMGASGMNLGDDNMGLSYSLVPHVCLLVYFSLMYKNINDIICVILGFFMVLAYGTRGPILCIIATFIGVWLLLNWTKLTIGKSVTFLSIIGIVSLIIWEAIPLIGQVLINSGFSDRIVGFLMSGDFAEDFGREMIQDVVMEQVKRNPSGFGLAYDRSLDDWWGHSISYSHNIVLELWISFGVIIGSILFACLLFLLIRGVYSAKTVNQKGFIIALICSTGLVRLFMSGTFLDSPELYLLIGVCICAIKKKKNSAIIYKNKKNICLKEFL